MKIGFSTIACPDYGPEEMAEAVRRYDYDGVELYAAHGETLTPELLASQLARFRRALSDVPIFALNSFAVLGELDPFLRDENEAAVRRALELASELRCPLVKAFGGEVTSEPERLDVTHRAAALLERAAARGGVLGVRLVIETHDGFCRGTDLAALLALVPEAHAGALWDVHHPARMGEATEVTDAAIGARVAHAHVKDAAREGEGWRFTPLGDGELPVPDLLGHLARRGFAGAVSVDYEKLWYPELDEPERSLPQHSRALRAQIACAERRASESPTPSTRQSSSPG